MPPLNDQFQITLSYQQLKRNLQQLLPLKRLSALSCWMEGWLVAAVNQESWEDKDKEDALKSQQRPTYLSPSGGHVRGPGRPPVLSPSIVRLVWGSRFRTHTSVFRLCAPDDGRWGRGAGSGNAQVMSTRVRACKTVRDRPVFARTPFITATVQHGSLADEGTRRQQGLATNTKLSFPIFFKLRLILLKHWDEFKSISLQKQAEKSRFHATLPAWSCDPTVHVLFQASGELLEKSMCVGGNESILIHVPSFPSSCYVITRRLHWKFP